MTEHTRPELATERRICGRIRAQILRDPCAHCLNRVEGWGKSACSLVGRRFSLCMSDKRPLKFELDESTIKRAA